MHLGSSAADAGCCDAMVRDTAAAIPAARRAAAGRIAGRCAWSSAAGRCIPHITARRSVRPFGAGPAGDGETAVGRPCRHGRGRSSWSAGTAPRGGRRQSLEQRSLPWPRNGVDAAQPLLTIDGNSADSMQLTPLCRGCVCWTDSMSTMSTKTDLSRRRRTGCRNGVPGTSSECAGHRFQVAFKSLSLSSRLVRRCS